MDNQKKNKIAVIGAGISGLGAAWLLAKKHNVTIFEADAHFGGHANTFTVETGDASVAVDTGFIVCNDRNYPNFLALLKCLNIEATPTDMSFAVSKDDGGFEYAGSDNISELLAQKRNILRPRFWKMVRSILRFYKQSETLNPDQIPNISLGDFLAEQAYDKAFLDDHILPMAAAIWSTPSSKVTDFPLISFLKFCQNHGLLTLKNRPQWYTIGGGSQEYVKALIAQTDAQFKHNTPIEWVKPIDNGVLVKAKNHDVEQFDKILLATHANISLAMIKDADAVETEILSAFKYAKNEAVLHSDKRFMPKRQKAWASWNYLDTKTYDGARLSLTYWMNKLQPLNIKTPLFVTLNPHFQPDEALIYYRKQYEHPIFDMTSFHAQKQLLKLMGHRNIYYAGAYFGYGFHEDGLQSGLYAAEQMGNLKRPWHLDAMSERIIALDALESPKCGFKPQTVEG